jgi:nucleotide-binding universal stress UspA family protein
MNVLIAVDFSAVTDRVVATVLRFATNPAAHRMFLVHVAPPDPDFVGYGTGPKTVRSQIAAELREQHGQLKAVADRLRAGGCEVTPLLLQGPTIETVLEEAERLEADLLVIGSHGHGAVYDLLVGSVSEGLVRRSDRPVLVVPAGRGKA